MGKTIEKSTKKRGRPSNASKICRSFKGKRLERIRRSRKKAIRQEKIRFYPNEPCVNGHVGAWYTLPKQPAPVCAQCRRENLNNWIDKTLLSSERTGEPPQWVGKFPVIPEATRPMPENCECCGAPRGRKAFARDHCHETGVFRGWLCFRCNSGLGKLGDNVEGVKRALNYLERCADGSS